MKTPRIYQDAAIKGLWNWLFTPNTGHPLVVAPVGAGKSLMIAEFIRQCHEQYPRTRIVVLAHVKELLVQNAEELRGQYPSCDYGFYCAGLGHKRLHNDVTFASIQSVRGKIAEFNRSPEIVIIDECHLISHRAKTQYRKFIDDVLAFNPNAKVIGFTGTPFRADTGRLDEGEGALFDGTAHEIGMTYMIDEGYWAKPVAPNLAFKMDVSGVGTAKGDYIESQLQEKVNTAEVTDACVKELIEKGAGRKRWLIFTAGIEHAKEVTAALNLAGVSADAIYTGKEDNDETLKRHKAGEFTALVNVAKLTTGYNDPAIDLLCFMRPTRSPVLYVQCMGRGVRPVYADGFDLSTTQGRLDAIAASNKPDCLVIDFGGVIEELGPIDQVSIQKTFTGEKDTTGEKAEPITKICPACGEVCAASQRYCYKCSYSFIVLDTKASEKAVISTDEPPEWVDVISMGQVTHRKKSDPDGVPSMKVIYATLKGQFYDFICFEHHQFKGEKRYFAYERAVEWFGRFADWESQKIGVPQKIEDAVVLTYLQPSAILVKRNGKYWNVIDYKFENKKEELVNEEDWEIPF